ncbi:MAG TPA: hypothetical protein VE009_10710 [Paenibacillus sp.]|nr:hypothetical protein [Paenibacillus sp.]
MNKSNSDRVIKQIKKNQGILKETLIAQFSDLDERELREFISTSKKIIEKDSEEGVRLYTKKRGCLGCLTIFVGVTLLFGGIAAISGDPEQGEEAPAEQVAETEQPQPAQEQPAQEQPEQEQPEQEPEQPVQEEPVQEDDADRAKPAPAPAPAEEKPDNGCASPTIKGNINDKGEKIYHVPGGAFYDRTDAEEMFCTKAEAEAAGYRRSKR